MKRSLVKCINEKNVDQEMLTKNKNYEKIW